MGGHCSWRTADVYFVYRLRSFSKKAMQAGYEVKGGVNKGLTYLVTNDKNSGSSKNKKDAQLGIKVINEDEFIKLISNISDDSLAEL